MTHFSLTEYYLMSNRNSNMREELKNFHDQKQLLMLNFSLVCKRESDYFQNALQENNSNNTNTAEVENLKRTILELREENNALKKENSTLKKESSSLKIDKANLSNERRNDARKIKRLENELKSSENKAKAVKVRHEKEVQKLNRRLTGKEKAVKMLRHGNTMNNIADMMSQKMSTRSSQHRQNPSIKSEPSETKSEPKSSNPKRSEADSVMKDDDEDEILASPQASQASQTNLFGDDLTRQLNSGTQQSAAYGTPTAQNTWSDE